MDKLKWMKQIEICLLNYKADRKFPEHLIEMEKQEPRETLRMIPINYPNSSRRMENTYL
jgi:hypothetical protein